MRMTLDKLDRIFCQIAQQRGTVGEQRGIRGLAFRDGTVANTPAAVAMTAAVMAETLLARIELLR
jgi:hypothetical protein